MTRALVPAHCGQGRQGYSVLARFHNARDLLSDMQRLGPHVHSAARSIEPFSDPIMRVVIVGGGLIGLGIALEALGRGCAVEVVDDDRTFAAYRASAGMLALPSEAQAIEAKLVELARESHRLYPDFVDRIERASGVPCNLSSVGSLYVALHRDEVAAVEHLAQAQARLEISAERLSGQEIREREPLLSPGVLAGLYAKERQIDPRRLHAALRAAVERLGGCVLGGEVTSLLRSGDGIDGVELQRGAELHRLECDHTVVAAGAWARKLLSPILGEVPLRPVKGLTLRLRGSRLLRRIWKAMSNIRRVLKPAGCFYILDTNPGTTGRRFSTFVSGSPDRRYEAGETRIVRLFRGEDECLRLEDYHWPKQAYLDCLEQAGFDQVEIFEPTLGDVPEDDRKVFFDEHGFDGWRDEMAYPPFILFQATGARPNA